MISLITTCLLLANAVVSLAVSQGLTLKILSPAPGTQIHPGVSLNVTLQIEAASINSSQQVLLGFGLNSEASQNPSSLGEIFLGLLNTTHTPFNASGQLTWSLSVPTQEKFNSITSSLSLVVSQYMFSGPSHTPHCGLVSVPVKVASPGSKPIGSGKGILQPWSPTTHSAGSPSNLTDPSAESGPPAPVGNNLTSSITKSEIKASMAAKGHNTAATIPATVAGGQSDNPSTSTPSKMNVTSGATTPPAITGNLPAPSSNKNGTASHSDSDSRAVHLAISTSHLIAALAGILAISVSL